MQTSVETTQEEITREVEVESVETNIRRPRHVQPMEITEETDAKDDLHRFANLLLSDAAYRPEGS